MNLRPIVTAAAVAAGISGTAAIVATPAHAQNAMEAEVIGFPSALREG